MLAVQRHQPLAHARARHDVAHLGRDVDELLALKESFFGRKCPEPELRRILYLERRSGFLRRWIAAKVDGAITKRPSWRHQLLLARCYVRLARIESRGGEDDELFEAIEQHVPQWMLEAVAEGRFSEEDLAPLVTGVTTEKLTP